MSPINKLGNEYADLLGDDYARTPKAVLAAVAVSFARMLDGDDPGYARQAVLDEWRALHAAGIVPQKPPK